MAESLKKMMEEVLKNRLNEAIMAVRKGEQILREIPAVAGEVNGTAALAEDVAAQLQAMSTRLDEEAKKYRPRSAVQPAERIDGDHAKRVREAKKIAETETEERQPVGTP